jgi:hypothetical protein
MRLDSNATTVASPASESLWGVGLLQSRERSPLSLGRIVDRDREEGRRREESRRREEERERAQEGKREGKLHSRDVRSQISPALALASPSPTYSLAPPTFSVGYALTPKKIKSFVQPKLEEYARYLNSYTIQHCRNFQASLEILHWLSSETRLTLLLVRFRVQFEVVFLCHW